MTLNFFLRLLLGDSITRFMYEFLLQETIKKEKVSIRTAERILDRKLKRKSIGVELGDAKRIAKPFDEFRTVASSIESREEFRQKLLKQIDKDFDDLISGNATRQERAVKRLFRERKRIVQETDEEAQEFVDKLKRKRKKQIRNGELKVGTNVTDKELDIVEQIRNAVYDGYRQKGVQIITGTLIQSLKVSVITFGGEKRYILESSVRYAKYVNGRRNFVQLAKSKTRQLTGTELIVRFK